MIALGIAVATAWTALLAWFVLAGLRRLLRRRRDAASPLRPAPPTMAARDRRPPGRRVRMTIQVLFAEWRGQTLLLDCLVLDGFALGIERGTPVSLRLHPPAASPLGSLVERTIEGWAQEAQVVDMEVRLRVPSPRARLTDGSAAVNLDLERALPG